jgi:16S rRNA (cytosine967-C5)-methyltransferase
MSNPRQIAFDALMKTYRDNAFSNLTLDGVLSKSDLDTRDKSFVSNLFYGVIERQLTIDYQLGLYLSKPLKKLKPEVLTIMRMGAYQILFMDKVPDSAAVNESIKLSKKNGASYASGLINAVLRKVAKSGVVLPENCNRNELLSVKYSCPLWLVDKWINEYGYEDTAAFLESSLGGADTYIRVNNTKITTDKLIEILSDEGVESEKTYNDNTLKINLKGHDIERLNSFGSGLYHVQDMASQLCAKALNAKEYDIVFDLCSAPGGKAYTIAETMNDKGRVLCFDIYENRVSLIVKGARRLGLESIIGKVGDASVFNSELGLADKVLCDVPCSGLGIIRRKPEIKYKNEAELSDLPEIQYAIIDNASKYVKKGGRMVYSTCTLSKAENEDVVSKFLENHSDFKAVPVFSDNGSCTMTLMPHKNQSDGFFIACLERDD